MSAKRNLAHIGSIANIDGKKRVTDKQIVDAMFEVDKKHEALSKELEKQQSSDDAKAKFQYAHFICIRSGTVIPREGVGRIQTHQSRCPFCSEIREQRVAYQEAWSEGASRMRFILSGIEKELATIEATQHRIEQERKLKQGDWETYINKYLKKNIDNTKASIFSLSKQKHSLLNHENEITRQSAQEMYDRYEKMTTKQRSRGDWK